MAKVNARQKMVDSAIDLFHLHGVNGTSVDRILEASGTGKGQFAHYFGNKDGLILASLVHLRAVIEAGEVSTGYRVRSWAEFARWFENFIAYQESVDCERSCPIGTIGSEISNDQRTIRQTLIHFLDWSRGELALFFSERKKAGELPRNVDPVALADLCISVMQGGMLVTKLKRSTDLFRNAAKQANMFIESLRVK